MAEELTNAQKLALKRQEKESLIEQENNMFSYEKINELTGYNSDMIAVLHKSVAKGTTNTELAYFLNYCKSSGLNPLNKEIWCYKNTQGDVIIFTGRDGFLKKNKENPNFRGMKSSEVCEFDEFEIDMIEGIIKHKISNNRGKVIGAYAIVYIQGMQDTIKWLEFDEFNLGQAKWRTSPKMMIKKCAESHALKEACGMTGIQAEESFIVKDNVASAEVVSTELKENHEKERLLLLIENTKNKQSLEKLKQYCNEPDLVLAYDEKMNSFE